MKIKKQPNFYYVYVITNIVLNNKQYVGSKVCYKDDPNTDGYWGSSKYLGEDYKIYGIENFTKEILKNDYKNVSDMIDGETEYILKYNTLEPNGYNRYLPNQRKGFHMSGQRKIPWNKGKTGVYSEETLNKMRKPKSQEHIKKMALSKIGNIYMKGKHLSKETKEKMRDSKLGKKHSIEHNINFSKARKGISIMPTSKLICPYCNKNIDARNYSRWHGEKCKLNN